MRTHFLTLQQKRRWRVAAVVAVAALGGCDPGAPGAAPAAPAEVNAVVSALTGRPPVLTKVDPPLGPADGRVSLTLTGRNFRPGATVSIAGVTAGSVTVVSSTQMTVQLPPKAHAMGRVPVRVVLPDGRATERSDLFSYYSDSLAFASPYTLDDGGSTIFVVADLNSDGQADLVRTSPAAGGVVVLLGNGDTTFKPATGFGFKHSTSLQPVVSDVNGDGKLDIVAITADPFFSQTSVDVLLGNGDGTFQPVKSHPIGYTGSPDSVTVADVNGDGKPDVIAAFGSFAEVDVFLGAGDGTFAGDKSFDVGPIGVVNPTDCKVADLNGDKKPDLVLPLSSSAQLAVMIGNGDGTFQAAKLYSSGANVSTVVIADLNGDAKLDVAATGSSGKVALLLGNGDGTLQAPLLTAVNTYGNTLFVTDLTGDTKPDLLVSAGSGLSLLPGNGDGTFAAGRAIATRLPVFNAAVADVDGDGKVDLMVSNQPDSQLGILLGHGDGSFYDSRALPIGATPSQVRTGDFNGDGNPDVAVSNFSAATVTVMLGNGHGAYQSLKSTAVGKSPAALTAGDLNRDGKPDLLTSNEATGLLAVRLNTTP